MSESDLGAFKAFVDYSIVIGVIFLVNLTVQLIKYFYKQLTGKYTLFVVLGTSIFFSILGHIAVWETGTVKHPGNAGMIMAFIAVALIGASSAVGVDKFKDMFLKRQV